MPLFCLEVMQVISVAVLFVTLHGSSLKTTTNSLTFVEKPVPWIFTIMPLRAVPFEGSSFVTTGVPASENLTFAVAFLAQSLDGSGNIDSVAPAPCQMLRFSW